MADGNTPLCDWWRRGTETEGGGKVCKLWGDVIIYYAAEHQWIISTQAHTHTHTHTHTFTTSNETLYMKRERVRDREREREKKRKRETNIYTQM